MSGRPTLREAVRFILNGVRPEKVLEAYWTLIATQYPWQQSLALHTMMKHLRNWLDSPADVKLVVQVFGQSMDLLEMLAIAAGQVGLTNVMEAAMAAHRDGMIVPVGEEPDCLVLKGQVDFWGVFEHQPLHRLDPERLTTLKESIPVSWHPLVNKMFIPTDRFLHGSIPALAIIAHTGDKAKFIEVLEAWMPEAQHSKIGFFDNIASTNLYPHVRVLGTPPGFDPHFDTPLLMCMARLADMPEIDHAGLVRLGKEEWTTSGPIDLACAVHKGGSLCGSCKFICAQELGRVPDPYDQHVRLKKVGLTDDKISSAVLERVRRFQEKRVSEVRREYMRKHGREAEEEKRAWKETERKVDDLVGRTERMQPQHFERRVVRASVDALNRVARGEWDTVPVLKYLGRHPSLRERVTKDPHLCSPTDFKRWCASLKR